MKNKNNERRAKKVNNAYESKFTKQPTESSQFSFLSSGLSSFSAIPWTMRNASTLKSGAVLALLRRILGSEGAALTEFIVRKTAHFTEFAIEGILLLSVVKGYTMRPLRFLGWPLLAGLMTALADETIQLFSLGRSSQVTDVWIDFAGVVTGTLLAFLVQAIVRRCKKS